MNPRTIARICLALFAYPWFAGADPGLIATFTDDHATIHTVVPSPAFSLRDNESVHPQVKPAFTARYKGSIKILQRGTYTFTNDGGEIRIDGKAVTAPVELEAGEHPIEFRYQRKSGPAQFGPTWTSDPFIPEPIPASVLSHSQTPDAAHQQALAERGRILVEEHNCAACHSGGAQHLASRVGPDLSNVGARVNAFWIYKWLEDPKHFRAAAMMPAILTKDENRRDVAAYLATLKDARRRVNDYKPSQSKAKQGQELFETIGCANCHQGDLKLEHQASKWQSIGQLAAYIRDPLAVDRSGRMPAMIFRDEDEAVALANYLVQSKDDAFEGKLPDGADMKHGEQIVRTAGCLACHTINGDAGKPLPDARTFAALDKLDPAKGCLAEHPDGQAARYQLSADDRQAIAAFLSAIKSAPLVSSAPAHDFQRTLQKLNCVACHEAGQSKPAEELAEKLPPLTSVGAKLKKDWINQVLHDRRARVRFWLKTRMPDFGSAVDRLPDQAVAAAAVSDAPDPKLVPTTAVVAEGQKLVGANDPKTNPTGMACVTCHSLREFKPVVAADATRGPELTLMYTRLRPDFFRRWMHEPARIQPGTAMPNFFTDKPRQEADHTIDTLWAYASLGISMPAPLGVKEKRNYVLIVTDTPLVSRCQIPDPNGTIVYGISVGLPGMVNYTFDAQRVMFRQAWQGGFLDMGGDWNDRGGNPVRVLGQRFYIQAISPIRIGSPENDAPRVFKGYELKDKIPTFIYTIGDTEVRERITSAGEGHAPAIVRTFEIESNGKPVYYLATDEPNVTISASTGSFRPAQVQKSFKSPSERTAGQILELPAANKVTFSVTITNRPG
ncbi:MAG TPA: c-type cytochrome [Tepidisphaeraceae bacterium]|jgi:mono/diheme cytochrome c family protein